MIAVLLLGSLARYVWGRSRALRAGRAAPLRAAIAFAAGLVSIAAVLYGPVDELADSSLSWHMLQHLVLVGVSAPLLLLGAPTRIMLAALPPRAATAVARALGSGVLRFLTHPAVAWLQFALVLYGTHFSPLYEAALENESVHAFEHSLYLGSALLFWMPLLGVAPAPHAPSHPVRLLSLFLALPMSAFLGFVLYVNGYVLYAHYARNPNALRDQANAGAVMWLAGGAPLFVALLWLVGNWAERERRYGAIYDAGP
jgi:putative membrane protein